MYSYKLVSRGVRRAQIPMAPCQLCEGETRLRTSQSDARSPLLEVCLEIRPESQLAGFTTAPERRNTVLNDMFVHATRFNHP